jgi:predicted enzyme related to lactoylglutathione lyase
VSPETQKRAIGRLRAIIIDVTDLDRASAFWSAMLGEEAGERRGNYQTIGKAPWDGSPGLAMVLQQVAEPKVGKVRIHVDFEVEDVDEALSFVEELGGSLVKTISEDDWTMIIAADTEGNEFCLIKGPYFT